jgi:hypothetical protein
MATVESTKTETPPQPQLPPDPEADNDLNDLAPGGVQIEWSMYNEELLAEWCDIAQCYKWLHTHAHREYQRIHTRFTIPSIILSTITGAASFASLNFSQEITFYSSIAIGTINILVGMLSAIQQYMQVAEMKEAHLASSVAWDKLARNIKIELSKRPQERMEPGHFIKISRHEFDRLMESGPVVSQRVVDKFLLTFSGGENADLFNQLTKPDICNSIVSINNTRRKWFDDPLAAAPPDATPPSLAPKQSLAAQINSAVFRRTDTRAAGDFSARSGNGGSNINMATPVSARRPVSYARRGSGDRPQMARQGTMARPALSPGKSYIGAPRSPPSGAYTPDPMHSGNSSGSANSAHSMFAYLSAGGGPVSDSDKARFNAYRLSSVDECDDAASQFAESTKMDLRPADVDLSAQGRRRNVVPPKPGGPALWTAARDVPYPAGTQPPTQVGRDSLPKSFNGTPSYSEIPGALTTSRITLTERRASYGDDQGIEHDYAAANGAETGAAPAANPQHISATPRKSAVPVLNLNHISLVGKRLDK